MTDLSLVNAYVAGVCREIQLCSGMAGTWSRMPVHTVYFGGGTPSLLSAGQMQKILDMVQNCFCLVSGPEITCEVNPGTVDARYLADLEYLGINRLSIGAQSFDPRKLQVLSRIHTRKQVFETLEGAGRAGFSNLGLDLMYGLPEETPDAWQADLDTALGFAPAHLSCYMLTIEPGTPFFDRCEKGQFSPCGRDRRMNFFAQTAEVLENQGYIHYEVSSFALGQKNRSVHNSHYWQRGTYLGMGPSAHSFVPVKTGVSSGRPSDSELMFLSSGDKGPVRSWNAPDVPAWLDVLAAGRLPRAGCETLTPVQEVLEQVMLGLRTENGMPVELLNRDIHAFLARLENQGLGIFFVPAGKSDICRRFRLTQAGLTCLDSIVDTIAGKIFDKSQFYDNF